MKNSRSYKIVKVVSILFELYVVKEIQLSQQNPIVAADKH